MDASPDTILQFHDQLLNELPTLRGKWSFSFKVFRSNPYSLTNGVSDTKFLHTISLSYLPETTITIVNKRLAAIFTNTVKEDANNAAANIVAGFPEDHLVLGATSGYNDPFDTLVSSKLQALWLQRQHIKGDGGQIYELENGALTIRTSNVFLHGIFKGLLIQIEISEGTPHTVASVVEKFHIPRGNISTDVIDRNSPDKFGDLALQYAAILNF